MSAATTIEIVEGTVTVIGTVPIGPRGLDGVGLPTGGTTGQVPTKASDDDFDIEWADGAGVTDGDKGDVVVSGIGTIWTVPELATLAASLASEATARANGDTTAISTAATDATTKANAAQAAAIAAAATDATTKVAAEAAARDAAIAAQHTTDNGTYLALADADERARDAIGAALVAGANVTVTVSDGSDTITIACTSEAIQDVVGAFVAAGTGITATYDDTANTLTIATTITQYTDEMARDALGAALTAGANVTLTVNDGADTITVAVTTEAIQDVLGAILAASGSGITVTYDDSGNTETIALSAALQDLHARWTVATTTVGGKLALREGTNNGTNEVVLKAPDSLASDVTVTLPAQTGTIGAAAFLGAAQMVRFIVDGGGSAITTGAKKAYITIPWACTITSWNILADQSGSIVFDIWKDTYANYPPTVADTITASAKPTLTTATKATGSTLTGWTTSISAGDVLEINVDSITTCTKVVLELALTRTG